MASQRATSAYPSDRDYLRRKVPPKDEIIEGPVGAPVMIAWDRWGLAHVRAATRPDVFFGLGYATAQECLWRLDYLRRQARGTLAAVLGRDALASDRAMRLLGISAHADALARDLPDDEAAALIPLAAGINRWIEEAVTRQRLPVEFDWLGYEPAPWTPADTIACWKYRWWSNTGRLENIAAAEAARRYLSPALLPAFMRAELGEETIIPSDAPAAARAAGQPPGGADSGEGSNNWVVDGSRTTTGYPVLCSDPHNAFSQPGQWLQAQLTATDGSLDAIGAIYASTPGIYMGRNRHVAWGFTNHVASTRDLYAERVDPARPNEYLDEGRWRPYDADTVSIEVRGEPSVSMVVRRTTRGPIVNELLPALGTEEPPMSLRWAGLELGSGLGAMLALNRATSVPAALDAIAGWLGPVLNALLADDQGRIAYHVMGRVPRRVDARRGYRRADRPEDAWQGYLTFEELPHMAHPRRGWLASANQPPWPKDPPGVAYLAGGAWADGNRMRRIRHRLTERERLSPQELASIQADITSQRAQELARCVVGVLASSGSPAAQEVAAALRAWDGRYGVETSGPTVWTAFWQRWLRRVAGARLPGHVVSLAQAQAGAVARDLLLGRDTTPPWFADRPVDAEIVACAEETIVWLEAQFGADRAAWHWGQVHTVTWRHALSTTGPEDRRQAARQVFDVGPFPTSGGTGTVRAAGHDGGRPFQVVSGATYRLMADLSPGGGLMATTTTGQSGHPGSPHYADQAPLWLEDRYHPCSMDEFETEGVTTIAPRTTKGSSD